MPSLLLFFLFLRNKIQVNCSLPLPYTFPYLLLIKWIILAHTTLFPSYALITHVCVQNTTTVLHFESLHECYNFIYPVAIWLLLTQWWLFSTAMAFACLNIPEFMYTNPNQENMGYFQSCFYDVAMNVFVQMYKSLSRAYT